MTDELKFQTPWRNLQGCECQITSNDWKNYSFHVGNPYNIVVSGFTSTVAANIAMRLRLTALKALSSTEQEANHQPDNLIEIGKRKQKRRASTKATEVATVTHIEPTYSFTSEEDAELVPAVETEDW